MVIAPQAVHGLGAAAPRFARAASHIKNSDWVIDMGPEGGFRGGTVVAQGTPEQIAKANGSYTGKYLAQILKNSPSKAG